MSFGLDIQEMFQSRWVSVSTSNIYSSLDELQSRHPQIIKVLLSHQAKQMESNKTWSTWNGWVSPVGEKNSRLTNLAIVSHRIHFMACRSFSSPLMVEAEISESPMESRYRHLLPSLCYWDPDFSSLGLVIETRTFSVSFSVSSLRLASFESRSRHWDSDIFSVGLGSCHWDSDIFSLGLGLDDQNLVSLIPGLWCEQTWQRGE